MNDLIRDRVQTGLLIGLVLIWVVLALGRCTLSREDPYGVPTDPGYAVPVGRGGIDELD
jgi:hypothetical protein